jgi:hypothetical protein
VKIFDIDSLGKDYWKATRGRKSKDIKISVSRDQFKIKFSKLLVDNLNLYENGLIFVLTDDQNWYMRVEKSEKAIPVLAYRGAYYIHAKVIVMEILNTFKAKFNIDFEITSSTAVGPEGWLLTPTEVMRRKPKRKKKS